MNGEDLIIIAVIVVVLVLVILKMTVFKGPKWKRNSQRNTATKKDDR